MFTFFTIFPHISSIEIHFYPIKPKVFRPSIVLKDSGIMFKAATGIE